MSAAPEIIPFDRFQGCLLGLTCGDAVGTTVEFQPRGSFPPVTDMVGGGPFGLEPGQWTDDTSMMLCLTESLLHKRGFDARDQMERYLMWRETGHMSSTGTCFDIGRTVEAALERFRATGEPFAGSTDPQTAGNGSLMRLAPIAIYYHSNAELVWRYAAESSRTTHGAPEAVECCQLLAYLLTRAFAGASKAELLDASALPLSEPKVAALARGDWARKTRDEIAGTGYCVSSLEAALWCFHSTDSLDAAILAAANLGDDADTTAAITGQIAGAFYGFGAIPRSWLSRLALVDMLMGFSQALCLHVDLRLARERATLDS